MQVDKFLDLVKSLTGTAVKEVSDTDRQFLGTILADNGRELDCSQFNELLLLVNKDRVRKPFFHYFFDDRCPVGDLEVGIESFQKVAMLLYGNFIYAYRILAAAGTEEQFKRELGALSQTEEDMVQKFKSRSQKVLEITPIPRTDTHLVGYLSASEIIGERERARLLNSCLGDAITTWEGIETLVHEAANQNELDSVLGVIEKYQKQEADAALGDFREYLSDLLLQLDERYQRLNEVREQATRNQDIYLTWDYMDVYFATSMRKRWEYESLFDFVDSLMSQKALSDLKLRHFDPTQCFTEDRINKGLVEALMLKRAKCTVYSVQDTDTLGKDSELAATLAQGKPVIAYVPEISVETRADELVLQDPSVILERLRFVLHTTTVNPEGYDLIRDLVDKLEEFERQRIWRSVPNRERLERFRNENKSALDRLCRIIANAEKRIYDKRFTTLKDAHPLGVQVHLESGVANGVMVVRNIDDCASLLRQVLTNKMEFELEMNELNRMWYLREKISKCVYRVVSSDRKLTNCFWNFYLKGSGESQ